VGGENLSQAEVASLTGHAETPAGQAAALRARGLGAPVRKEPVVPSDFQYAERMGPEALRVIDAIHQAAARDISAALTALARSPMQLRVSGMRQMTCAEFIRGLDNPSCFCAIKCDALGANVALDIGLPVMFPLIDRLLGGSDDEPANLRRPLTEIERRLAARVVKLWTDALARSWAELLPLTFELVRIDSTPHGAGLATASELVLVVMCELTVGSARGMAQLCLPRKMIDRVRAQLAGRQEAEPDTPSPIAGLTAGDPHSAQLIVELAHIRLPRSELVGLRVGDIIATDVTVDRPLVVSVDGVPRFHARPGAYQGQRAICIEESLERPQPGTADAA